MNGDSTDGPGSEPTVDARSSTDDPDDGPESAWVSDAVTRERLVRVGHVLGVLALIAFVLPFVLYAVPQLIGAEYSYVVLSGSMQPAMGPGDITFVDDVPPSAVEDGDVITFKRPADERTTTHRVVDVVDAADGSVAFQTKGDNNENVDQGVVTPGEFRGRVMEFGGALLVVPLVGYVLQFTNSGPGFVLLFVVPLVLLVANEIWNVVSTAAGDQNEPSTQAAATLDRTERQSAATGRPSDPDAESDIGTGESDVVTVSPAELRLGVGILAGFTAYSVWVAWGDPGAFTVGVAGSTAVGLLMLAGLYWQGTTATNSVNDEPGAPPVGVEGVTIRTGNLAHSSTAFERNSASSLASLVELAAGKGGQLYRTPDGSRYHLSVGTTLYVYDATDADATRDPEQVTAPGSVTADGQQPDSLAADGNEAPDTGGDAGAGASEPFGTPGSQRVERTTASNDVPPETRLDSNLEADDD